MARLGDVGKIITGNTPKTSDALNYSSNDICFVKPSDILGGEITVITDSEFYISNYARDKARILPPKSVLVTCIGIIGKVAINNVECAFNQQINAIVPDTSKCLTEYLAYAIQNKQKEMQDIANAPVVPILNKTQFSEIEIELPSIESQTEVVAKMRAIDDLISLRKQQLSKLDELVKSRFIEMFGDIHEPSKWDKKPWSEVVTIQNGRDYKNILVESGGYPVYGTGGEMARASDYLCPENTIIVGRKGTINNPLLVKEKFWNVDTAFGVIVGNQLHYQYFYNFCRMFDFSTLNKQAVLPSTTKADLLKIEIAVPPMELQNHFATFVEQTDKSKLAIQQSLEKLETLKKALMQKYFE